MPKTHVPYAPEFRQQMIDLVRAGRTLGREFECSAQTIRNWVRQAERDAEAAVAMTDRDKNLLPGPVPLGNCQGCLDSSGVDLRQIP